MNHSIVSGCPIVTFASGKGGVGKTAIALALANELSASGNRILILDFDLYNRGLLELSSSFAIDTDQTVTTKRFFENKNAPYWKILKLDEGIVTINVPAFGVEQLRQLESLTIQELQIRLSRFIEDAIVETKVNVVIIDCHGGRDVFSYVATAISHHVIIVSAPETITFFGTIGFIEGFNAARDELSSNDFDRPQLHILLNSVMEDFHRRLLSLWYKENFKEYADDEDFLAIIPFEPRTSIASGEGPLPTKKFYYSGVAEAIRRLAVKLFDSVENVRIQREAYHAVKQWQRWSWFQGSIFQALLIDRVALYVVIFLSAVVLGLMFEGDLGLFVLPDHIKEGVTLVFAAAVLWLFTALIAGMLADQDTLICGDLRQVTWKSAAKGLFRGACTLLGLACFVGIAVLFVVLSEEVKFEQYENILGINDISQKTFSIQNVLAGFYYIFGIFSLTLCCGFFVRYCRRFYRTVKFRRYSAETIYRIFGVLIIVCSMSLAVL